MHLGYSVNFTVCLSILIIAKVIESNQVSFCPNLAVYVYDISDDITLFCNRLYVKIILGHYISNYIKGLRIDLYLITLSDFCTNFMVTLVLELKLRSICTNGSQQPQVEGESAKISRKCKNQCGICRVPGRRMERERERERERENT